jgi:hypothetical protein
MTTKNTALSPTIPMKSEIPLFLNVYSHFQKGFLRKRHACTSLGNPRRTFFYLDYCDDFAVEACLVHGAATIYFFETPLL